MSNTNFWFATQVDRDFKTLKYGEDQPRLYYNNSEDYVLIEGVSYENDILIVKDSNNKLYILEDEPDNTTFESTLHREWKIKEQTHKQLWREDLYDYEPWAYNSKKSLANELKFYNQENKIIAFYGKTYLI